MTQKQPDHKVDHKTEHKADHKAEHKADEHQEDQMVTPPRDLVEVRFVRWPEQAAVSHDGKFYTPDKDGKVKVPRETLDVFQTHGFLPC